MSTLRASYPLVAAGFVISFVLVGGGIDTVGVFINAIARSTDWARSALSLAVSVGAVTGALTIPLVGVAIDRFGVRVPMTVGVGLLAVGFAIVINMQVPWHFVAANVFLGAGFAACALLPLTVAIAVRVRERTALALGTAAAGASAGALVLAPVLQAAVESLGWRGTYVYLGAAVVLTPIPLLLFALPRGRLAAADPDGAAPGLPGLAELRRPGVPGLVALLVLPGVVTFGVSVHLVPLLTDLGFSGRTAALALGGSVGVAAVGKIFGGGLADGFGALRTLRVALLLGAGSFALLAFAASRPLLACFVALYGTALGTHVAVFPVLARQVLGSQRFGTLFGALQLLAMLAAAVGPVAVGGLYDATGGYSEAIVLWGVAMALAVLVAGAMRVPGAEGA